jgi:hypothetical protein
VTIQYLPHALGAIVNLLSPQSTLGPRVIRGSRVSVLQDRMTVVQAPAHVVKIYFLPQRSVTTDSTTIVMGCWTAATPTVLLIPHALEESKIVETESMTTVMT